MESGSHAAELWYVGLLFALFVVPRVLLRWRIPTAATSLGLGVAAGIGLGRFRADPTVELLSTLGIVSLFLLAGLHVEVAELRREARVLAGHCASQLALLAAVAWGAGALLDLDGRPAVLLGLALVTPSAGFILDSLGGLAVDGRHRFWIRSKAIATEIVALAVLFVVLQSTTGARLAGSLGILLCLIGLVPFLFRLFASAVLPWAPKSEFAFLVMVAAVSAFVTRELGVYYLVGAFVVGVTAQRFRVRLPALSSEKMLHAVEAFASLFVPFYFFHAGVELRGEDFSPAAFLAGAAFLAVALPLRVAVVSLFRRVALGEGLREVLRVSVPLLPTLVFTLVLAGILRERFGLPEHLVGGLVLYAVVNTMIPGLVFRLPTPEFGTNGGIGAGPEDRAAGPGAAAGPAAPTGPPA